MATKKAQEQKTRTVQLELWSDWRSCGFAECELENLTADDLYDLCCNTDICGLDMGDLGGTLTVDGEDVSIDPFTPGWGAAGSDRFRLQSSRLCWSMRCLNLSSARRRRAGASS